MGLNRYDLYVYTLTLLQSKTEMVSFFETKKITSDCGDFDGVLAAEN